jgi:hypothetical protein
MNCTPSQQALRIESQLISADAADPFVGSPMRMALNPLYADIFEMNRHEPDDERDARKTLINRLLDTLDTGRAETEKTPTDASLPAPMVDITVDDYLAAHEQALANKQIAAFRPLGEFMLVELLDGRVLVQQTNLTLEMPIEPMLICLDHTQYWSEGPEVTEAGRIYTTYLTDISTGTHLCEMEPSFDLRHLYSNPANDNEERTIGEWVSQNDDPSDIYLHARLVNRLPESAKLAQQREYMEAGDGYEKTMERMKEKLVGNVQLQTREFHRDEKAAPGL